MKTTQGWSKGKKHRDGGDLFSLGGRKRNAPITLAKIGAHDYFPSAMHQGDCATCGHVQDANVHNQERKRSDGRND